MTNYERILGQIEKAKKNAEYYQRKNDEDDEHLVKFWSNCVTALQKRLDSLTIAQASVRVAK